MIVNKAPIGEKKSSRRYVSVGFDLGRRQTRGINSTIDVAYLLFAEEFSAVVTNLVPKITYIASSIFKGQRRAKGIVAVSTIG